MKHLLLFSIGPVQSFISQARKTHDLYAGSRLLSDLVKAAIKVVGVENLIFPKLGAAMPNRFLATVSEKVNDYKNFGYKVEEAVREEWKKIANDVLGEKLKKPLGFDQQIENFLEIFWCIIPFNDKQDYKNAYSRSERELAAIKNIRAFNQYTWQNDNLGERGRKCSLDGQRNVQFFRPRGDKNPSEISSPLYSTEGGVYISTSFGNEVLQPGEGLSAVSFVKRNYKYFEIGSFKSTVEIALLDALKDLEQDTCGRIRLQEYKNQIFSSFNSQLFFEDSLTDSFFTKQGISIRNCELNRVKEKRKALEESTDFEFQKYYAVLIFDGDDMGKWWSGENLRDQSHLMDFQKELADCLSKFAAVAKTRLDTSSGETVYAGGDDFLGFVNINHLLPLLEELRKLFEKEVGTFISEFTDKKISFSAGICVAHYKEPLTLVLQEARKAQEKAKDIDGKDAFAISVIKGSGESHITVLPFNDSAANASQIGNITKALIKEEFSTSFTKNLKIEFERLTDLSEAIQEKEVEDMFRTELYRLLKRSATDKWSKEKKATESKNMMKRLMELFGFGSMGNFFQMLYIIDFFHRALDKPGMMREKEPSK